MTPQSKAAKLPHEFYRRSDVLTVSKDLLGKLLVVPGPNGNESRARSLKSKPIADLKTELHMLTEGGGQDELRRCTGSGGVAYVYFVYGMYYQFNVVSGVADVPHAILVRALEPVEGSRS